MRLRASYLSLIFACALPNIANSDEAPQSFSQRWSYPKNSTGGEGESTGTASFSRSTRRTTDDVEKVVLWYAERVGLAQDHTLVVNATAGFSKLKKRLKRPHLVRGK